MLWYLCLDLALFKASFPLCSGKKQGRPDFGGIMPLMLADISRVSLVQALLCPAVWWRGYEKWPLVTQLFCLSLAFAFSLNHRCL